jgi:hypothetical protein
MMKTIYKCSRCDFEYPSIVVYQRHMKAVHNLLPVNICKICNEKCIGNDEFDKHLQFTHGTNHWDLNLILKQTKRTLRRTLEK